MFKGEQSTSIASNLSEEQFYEKVQSELGTLGRVKVSKKGDISIEAKESLKSFLTDITMDGSIKKRSNGEYEVVVSYSLAPSVINWVAAVVLFITTCFGAAIVLVPMLEKGKVDKAAKDALRDLEETA